MSLHTNNRVTNSDRAARYPLIAAAAAGQVARVSLLLRSCCSVNETDPDGSSALHLAAMMGESESARLLLDARADANLSGGHGALPLMIAAQSGHVDVVRLLLSEGADVLATVHRGNVSFTALVCAAWEGQTRAAQALLDATADPDCGEPCKPLIVAAKNGFLAFVHALIAASANVNAVQHQGFSALMVAARAGHGDVVHALLAAGANVKAVSNDGYTALSQAHDQDHTHVANLLRHAGAAPLLQPDTEPDQTTLSTSDFKRLYRRCDAPEPHAIIMAAEQLVRHYTARAMTPDEPAICGFCARVRAHLTWAGMHNPREMAIRLWTCPVCVQGAELCFMLNDALRRDHRGSSQALIAAVTLTEAINAYLLGTTQQHWPTDGRCFRGGGLPTQHRGFFAVGRRYRAPAFVATSFSLEVAMGFAHRCTSGEPVLWTLCFDRSCKHVAFIARNQSAAMQAEFEFLVAPYTAFEVIAVTWASNPSSQSPHHLLLRVASDNKLEPEDLPLAPWT